MKRIVAVIKKFFFPPQDSPRWLRVLPFAILGVFTLFALFAGNYVWEYTNSPEFCGTTCHTMPPEYSTYQNSPHARVRCVECHIGRDAFATQITRKAGDLRHVVFNLTGAFEYPIRSRQMRPARESCETCHFPEKFSDDSLREIHKYADDEENMWTTTYLLMSTGGGSARDGLGFGIHWHIENPVYYLPEGELEQEIPYVRVQNADGSFDEYLDVSSDLNISEINDEDLLEMDCITCHNRITHLVPLPEEAINNAITNGVMSAEIPFVVLESVALLSVDYETKEEGYAAMIGLVDVFQAKYPEVAASYYDEIVQASLTLGDIYDQYIFPDQEMKWDTHPNNLGHKDFPGCFRCHDGGHLSEEKEVIRLECNVCHSIPVVSDRSELVTYLELSGGVEPQSHTNTSWMTLHGKLIDKTCENCHASGDSGIKLVDMEGKPPEDNSFCGNSACHSSVWTFAAFDEDALQPYLQEQLASMAPPPDDEDDEDDNQPPSKNAPLTFDDYVGPTVDTVCTVCHAGDASGDLDLSSFENLMIGGRSGPAVIPGDPDASPLIEVQIARDHYVSLSGTELIKIVEWVLLGAPEQ